MSNLDKVMGQLTKASSVHCYKHIVRKIKEINGGLQGL